MNYQNELDFAKQLALQAGKIMRRYFRAEDIGTKMKEDATPITEADIRINQLVIKEVKKHFPQHGVLGEELSYEPEREKIWIVDPVDGTAPFSLGIPISTFLLALVDRKDGQPVVGVVYDPYLDHLYSASKGQGAHLNALPIHVSKSIKLNNQSVAIHGPIVKMKGYTYYPGATTDKLRQFGTSSYTGRSGAYFMAKVASSEFAASIVGQSQPWDVAAPAVVVREAGGIVTDIEGRPLRFDEFDIGTIMAANQAVVDQIVEIIHN
jgi:myo-inositol-1(or 4)-monophosphatase